MEVLYFYFLGNDFFQGLFQFCLGQINLFFFKKVGQFSLGRIGVSFERGYYLRGKGVGFL